MDPISSLIYLHLVIERWLFTYSYFIILLIIMSLENSLLLFRAVVALICLLWLHAKFPKDNKNVSREIKHSSGKGKRFFGGRGRDSGKRRILWNLSLFVLQGFMKNVRALGKVINHHEFIKLLIFGWLNLGVNCTNVFQFERD